MKEREKTPYLGSVRFFRHVILGTIGLLIAVPTALSIVFAVQNFNLRAAAAEPPEPAPAVTAVTAPPEAELPEAESPLVETPAWQALCPDLYAPPAERATVNEEKTCYLTFDDGPSARTPEILEILEQYGVKATFFVVGRSDEQSRQWMRDIVAAGHTLGLHSYTHDYKTIYASVENFLTDYEKLYQLILDATGVAPTVSRFPGGSINGYNGATYENILSELVRRGFVYFDWNVATGDAATGGVVPAGTLVKNAMGRAETLHRAVVLMHDAADKKTTVEALPAIIEGYQAAGYTFAALTPEVVPVIYTYPN